MAPVAWLLLSLAPADAVDEKFRDVTLEKAYAPYLRGNALLMEVAGAKVVRLKNGRRIVLGIGSVVLKDAAARTRIDAEKVCKVKALAAVVGEREGVQVAHEEKIEDKTVIVIDEKGEKGKSVSEVLSITRTKTQGVVKGMSVVGKWLSKDGKVLYLAMGSICDSKGEPIEDE
jgi:hypothetical protein